MDQIQVMDKSDQIKKIICIMSGKGGVGKSTVTVMLADALINRGYRLGILDADITGSSIPNLLKINNVQLSPEQDTIKPYLTEKGLQVVSINLMLDDQSQPVVWRGTVLANVLKNIWTKAKWDHLDYLLIDMPPGSSDIVLTVLQQIHPNAVIMVSNPQELVQSIVNKATELVYQMNIKVLGTIINMSFYTCPCCGKEFTLYQDRHVQNYKHRVIGELPALQIINDLAETKEQISEIASKYMGPITELIVNELKFMY